MPADTYQVAWRAADAARADHEATVFTCANGRFATRGAHPESSRGLPAACLAGVFTDDQRGFRTIVSVGEWLSVALRIGQRQFDPFESETEEYCRTYDLRRGVVTRRLRWRYQKRAAVAIETEHFVSLADRHCGAQRYVVTALDKPVTIELAASATTRIKTRGEWMLKNHRGAASPDGGALTARTTDERYRVALAAAARIDRGKMGVKTTNNSIAWTARIRLQPGESATLEKFVALAADREAGDDYADVAAHEVARAAERGFDALLRRHAAAWRKLWPDIAIEIEGDDDAARAMHFVVAQLMAHAPRDDDRAGLGAKPLSAEGYRGHVFWDTDLFMTPAVSALRPDLGAHLVNYRYETLGGARRNAAKHGYAGAWYPWEAAEDGDEVTPLYWVHADGRRMPITCWKHEIHSICGVAYATWDHFLATGDRDWLFARGAEVLLETARHWPSRAVFNQRADRYELHDVCGPDEAHEHVNNSAYINVLAKWNVERALETLAMFKAERPDEHRAFCGRLALRPRELADLRRFARRLYIPQDRRTGWYRQFDGFEDLWFIDPLTAEDRFEEPPEAECTQTVKQADVVMLLYLLRDEHTRAQMEINWDYYVPRTAHGTSLSAATHAAVAARLGFFKAAERHFTQAVNMDLLNWRGDSGRGLHGAALGGAICAAAFGFGGIKFQRDHLLVDPALPPSWTQLRVPFVYQGRKLLLDVTQEGFTLSLRSPGDPVIVVNAGQRKRVSKGKPLRGACLPPVMQKRVGVR